MKKQYSSKERKIWKLKRANVRLGQQRSALLNELNGSFNTVTLNYLVCVVANYSEQIGRNSLKIQRLRTLIQQEKKASEHSNCS